MAVNRRVTIAQIAESAGVSPATVSRAFNHPELVNDKTLGRINASIRSLGYGGPVEQYREGSSDCRGLVVVNLPWLDNPFYSEIVHGVRVAAHNAGYDMLISWDNITNETASSFCSMLRRCGASGVITTSPLSAEAIQAVEAVVPLVQCAESRSDVDAPYVTIDDHQAARRAAEHLISCGCTRLGIVAGSNEFKFSRERLEGFLDTTARNDVRVLPGWILQVPDNSYALAYSALTHLFDSGEVPDGIFAVSDTFGAAVVRAAHTTGIEIPRDLKVVGFDNAELSTMLTPTLTTVNQPRYRMGYSACRILIDLLAGNELGSRSMVLETELIVRESTAGEVTGPAA